MAATGSSAAGIPGIPQCDPVADLSIAARCRSRLSKRIGSRTIDVVYGEGPTEEGLLAEIARLRRDLAEKDRALAALRESQETLQLLIDTTSTGCLTIDEEGRVIDCNTEYVRLTGHERLDEIRGRRVTEWTAPHDLARNAQAVRQCVERGFVRNLEIDYVDRQGAVTPLEINATVHPTPGGTVILTICRDITDRRRALAALRESETQYRTTIDAMPELIHVVDEELRIVLMNRRGLVWTKQLGLGSDPLGRRVFDLYPFLPEGVRTEYQRVFSTGEPALTEERNTVGNVEIVTETRKIPVREGGRTTKVITVIRDITEMVRAQERLHQSEKMEALGQLAGGIAHDFNNQLAAMLGFAELLARRLEQGELRDYAATIARTAARSAELTRQLLTFARRGLVRTEPVDVHAVLREVAELLRRTIDKRIVIELELFASCPATLGDSGQLLNAFLNLALNARDAMPAGGVLHFATDIIVIDDLATDSFSPPLAPGGYLQVRVTDTGTGMTEETKRRLFEPFFTTKGVGKGTGMGLAAVYGTVVNHRGAIQVQSEIGRGSSFAVLLPLSERPCPAESEAEAEAPGPRHGAHLLLADDEPAVLSMVAAALRHAGYRVTACKDGVDALQFYREHWRDIDLVILDWMMPELTGPESLSAMRKVNPRVKAILSSGAGSESHLQDDDSGVAVQYIQKPFHLSELSARVVTALGA